MGSSAGIGALLGRMEGLLEPLEASGDPGRFFLATYLRTTRAVAEELDRGGFRDPAWVERWDVAFADLYVDAVEDAQAGRRPPEPWAVAFGAGDRDGLPPLRHVLLGMNAHINYDLAQSLLAVISEAGFDDPELLARRHPRRRSHSPRPGRPQARHQRLRRPPPRRLTRRVGLGTAPRNPRSTRSSAGRRSSRRSTGTAPPSTETWTPPS
jgi:Family of unknown function (DUF5995)